MPLLRREVKKLKGEGAGLCIAILRGGAFNSLQGRDGLPTRQTLGR